MVPQQERWIASSLAHLAMTLRGRH